MNELFDAIPEFKDVGFIDAEKLRRMQMLHVRFLLFDLRSPELFAMGHLPSAFNLPAAEFAEKISAQVPLKETPIVIYGDDAVSCAQAFRVAEKNGYINLVALNCPYSAIADK